ncbi:hypothetical protein U1Q18_031251, partial [Sarracenia purpurea var. burkii]
MGNSLCLLLLRRRNLLLRRFPSLNLEKDILAADKEIEGKGVIPAVDASYKGDNIEVRIKYLEVEVDEGDSIPMDEDTEVASGEIHITDVGLTRSSDIASREKQIGDFVGISCDAHQVFDKLSKTPFSVARCISAAEKPPRGDMLISGAIVINLDEKFSGLEDGEETKAVASSEEQGDSMMPMDTEVNSVKLPGIRDEIPKIAPKVLDGMLKMTTVSFPEDLVAESKKGLRDAPWEMEGTIGLGDGSGARQKGVKAGMPNSSKSWANVVASSGGIFDNRVTDNHNESGFFIKPIPRTTRLNHRSVLGTSL